MPACSLSPVFNIPQFFDSNGKPLSGGKIFTYQAGSTSVQQATYIDPTGSSLNTNPIVLDSAGRLTTAIWLVNGQSYNMVLTAADGTTVLQTFDNITGSSSSSGSVTSVGLTATGTGLTISNSPITSAGNMQIGGVLNIASGGTGGSSKSVGFNNLSPITAQGDLIVGGLGGTSTRLPVGTAGQVLTTNGTTVSWTSVSSVGTATNLSGGNLGQVPFQTAPNTTTFTPLPPSSGRAGLGWTGSTVAWDSPLAATNGYAWAGGILIQWGKITGFTDESSKTVSFPIAFPTACLNATATLINFPNDLNMDQGAQINSFTATTLSACVGRYGGGTFRWPADIYWMAIGY